ITRDRESWTNQERLGSNRLALQLAAFPFGQPTPDAEPLIVLQRIFEALHADFTRTTDLLRFPGRAAFFRKERLGVGLSAQSALLPVEIFTTERMCHDQIGHCTPPCRSPAHIEPPIKRLT